MAAVSRMSNPERVVITAVLAGVLRIDDQGRVWRNTKRGEVRAEKKLPNGYLQVRWMTGGVRYCAGAHRLVWQSVHGDITDGMTINHKNGLRDQNNIGNLEQATYSEQAKHAHSTGLHDQHGEKNPGVKLTDNQVAQIRLAYSHGGNTQQQLADRFGVSFQAVSKIVKGQRRPKQAGSIAPDDNRYCASERDAATGKFIGKKAAGRLLEGRTHDGFPATQDAKEPNDG